MTAAGLIERLPQMRAALILLAALLAGAASAETVDGARFVIIDGDTVSFDGERIRILNIDAPESFRSRCEAELIVGLRAKERLAALLRSGRVTIDRCEPGTNRCRDRYGRTLARLRAGGRDVGEVLISERLALPWRAGAEARAERLGAWCGR